MEKSLGQDRVNDKGRRIWDANSSLYDSYELNSFRRQLDSAIVSSARSQSMPHLSDRRRLPPPPQQQTKSTTVSKKHKIFRSLNKFLKSFLRHKVAASSGKVYRVEEETARDKFYSDSVSNQSGGELSTIHECPECGCHNGLSSDHDSSIKSAKNKSSDDSIIFNKSKFVDEDLIIVKKLAPDRRLTSSNPIYFLDKDL